jgi:hypothetical protein
VRPIKKLSKISCCVSVTVTDSFAIQIYVPQHEILLNFFYGGSYNYTFPSHHPSQQLEWVPASSNPAPFFIYFTIALFRHSIDRVSRRLDKAWVLWGWRGYCGGNCELDPAHGTCGAVHASECAKFSKSMALTNIVFYYTYKLHTGNYLITWLGQLSCRSLPLTFIIIDAK